MITEELLNYLEDECDYFMLRVIEGRGIVGLQRMLFTIGLCYGVDKDGLQGRYCYDNILDAMDAINSWDGKNDAPGNWIKHKGKSGEYGNPNLENVEF